MKTSFEPLTVPVQRNPGKFLLVTRYRHLQLVFALTRYFTIPTYHLLRALTILVSVTNRQRQVHLIYSTSFFVPGYRAQRPSRLRTCVSPWWTVTRGYDAAGRCSCYQPRTRLALVVRCRLRRRDYTGLHLKMPVCQNIYFLADVFR